MLRRKKLHEKACRAIAERTGESRPADCGGDLDSKQLQETLRGCIARLPDSLRSVVLLRDLAEMPYTQVAKILGISVSTARVYRCRSIRLLNAMMAGKEGG